MNLRDARIAVLQGTPMGDVLPLLKDDDRRNTLREWFVTTPTLPNLDGRNAQSSKSVTGNACPQCQGLQLVRTGSCVTCQDCGYNEGCG